MLLSIHDLNAAVHFLKCTLTAQKTQSLVHDIINILSHGSETGQAHFWRILMYLAYINADHCR